MSNPIDPKYQEKLRVALAKNSFGKVLFPIKGNKFNIGYDAQIGNNTEADWQSWLNSNAATHNTDFGFGTGDQSHRNRGGHLGIDIFAETGTELVACIDGEITQVNIEPNSTSGGGTRLHIYHKNSNLIFYYAHCNTINVKVGDQVKAGDIVGTVGKTGGAVRGRPHLHFSIYDSTKGYYSDSNIDPFQFLLYGLGQESLIAANPRYSAKTGRILNNGRSAKVKLDPNFPRPSSTDPLPDLVYEDVELDLLPYPEDTGDLEVLYPDPNLPNLIYEDAELDEDLEDREYTEVSSHFYYFRFVDPNNQPLWGNKIKVIATTVKDEVIDLTNQIQSEPKFEINTGAQDGTHWIFSQGEVRVFWSVNKTTGNVENVQELEQIKILEIFPKDDTIDDIAYTRLDTFVAQNILPGVDGEPITYIYEVTIPISNLVIQESKVPKIIKEEIKPSLPIKSEKEIPKSPVSKPLDTRVVEETQKLVYKDLVKKLYKNLLLLLAPFGAQLLQKAIEGYEGPNLLRFKTQCPPPTDLSKLIEARNQLVNILNKSLTTVSTTQNVVTASNALLSAFQLTLSILKKVPYPTTGIPPLGLPPLTAGNIATISSNIEKLQFKIRRSKSTVNSLQSILAILEVFLQYLLSLIRSLDTLIQQCAEESGMDYELIGININSGVIGAIPPYKGFTFEIKNDSINNTSYPKRYACALDSKGIAVLKSESSFTANTQTLINELKFIIDRDNLNPY